MGRVRRFLINNVPTHCCPHGGHCQWCHLGLGTAPNRGPCSRTSCPSTAWASFGVKKPGRCRPWCVRGSERGVQGSRCCRCVVAGAPGWAAVSSAQILPLPAGPFRARAGFCWKPAEPASPAASLGLWLGAGPAPGPRGGGGHRGQDRGLVAPWALPVPAGETGAAAVPTLSPRRPHAPDCCCPRRAMDGSGDAGRG